jgi:lipopolysaccharide/colanic/teichoic acid biosynthesis glycosyltransferase
MSGFVRALGVTTVGDFFSLTAVDRPIDSWDLWLKRMRDVVVSATAIAILSPLLLGVALAIRLDSDGPIIFRQKTGLNGELLPIEPDFGWKRRLSGKCRLTLLIGCSLC